MQNDENDELVNFYLKNDDLSETNSNAEFDLNRHSTQSTTFLDSDDEVEESSKSSAENTSSQAQILQQNNFSFLSIASSASASLPTPTKNDEIGSSWLLNRYDNIGSSQPQAVAPFQENLRATQDLELKNCAGASLDYQQLQASSSTQDAYFQANQLQTILMDVVQLQNLKEQIPSQNEICISALENVITTARSLIDVLSKKRQHEQSFESEEKESKKQKKSENVDLEPDLTTERGCIQYLAMQLQDHKETLKRVICNKLNISAEVLNEIAETVMTQHSPEKKKDKLLALMLTHPKLVQAAKWLQIYSHAKSGAALQALFTIHKCIRNNDFNHTFKMYIEDPSKPKIESILIINILMQIICIGDYTHSIDSFNANHWFKSKFAEKETKNMMILCPPCAAFEDEVTIAIPKSFSKDQLNRGKLYFGTQIVEYTVQSNDNREQKNAITRIGCKIPQGQGNVCVKFCVENVDVGVCYFSYPAISGIAP